MKSVIIMFVFGLAGTFVGVLLSAWVISPLIKNFANASPLSFGSLLYLLLNGIGVVSGLLGGIILSRRFRK